MAMKASRARNGNYGIAGRAWRWLQRDAGLAMRSVQCIAWGALCSAAQGKLQDAAGDVTAHANARGADNASMQA
jgi:hypothetical protein